ncbi:MAG: AI-2E family transporter [Deltaproteobacteria bacterium]|nr:MAG: AI-2E family transporter [Deltaproteobacteria bacterium]
METKAGTSKAAHLLIVAASFVIVVAGMRAASSILVPFLLAMFIAIICAPPLFWMQRKGVPNTLAVLSILAGIIVIGLLLAAFVGSSVNEFSKALPLYEKRLADMTAAVVSWLQHLGVEISGPVLTDYFDPGKAMKMAANTLAGLSGLLTNVFMILLTVIFILLEASGLPQKLRTALGGPDESLGQFRNFTESVNRYLALKTVFSLATGVTIAIWLAILGVDFALLWGLVAFLLNYVPNIGSIIAAIPAILLALLQLGWGPALLTCLGYVVANVVFGSILEPKFMGRRLGLSTLVVFLSLVFWGWVLGPVGMVLSVPLTMIVKIAMESNEDTQWIAVMLG